MDSQPRPEPLPLARYMARSSSMEPPSKGATTVPPGPEIFQQPTATATAPTIPPPGSPNFARGAVPRDLFGSAYRAPRNDRDGTMLGTAPSPSRTRVWTGPALPPFKGPASPLPNYVARSSSSGSNNSKHNSTMSPRELVVEALGSYLVDETFSNSIDDVGTGDVAYIVTGKGLKTSSHSSSNTSNNTSNATTSIASRRLRPIPAPAPPFRQQVDSSPVHAVRLSAARRASSPSLVTPDLSYAFDIDAVDNAVPPRRASADSSFGRSTDDMPCPPTAGITRNRSTFTMSSSVGSLTKPWDDAAKRRTPDEGVRASLRNLANMSSAKGSRIPSSLASTGTLIKDKAIKHIKTPSGGKYDGEILDILEISPKDFARQLTLMDSQVFRDVPREELASIAWTGPDKSVRAPRIVATTHHFNQVALWVAEQIVLAEKIKRRFQLVCHFIGVAKYCLDLNNFNGLRSITAGLQSTPVHRLERTWAMVGRREKAVFDKMCDLMSPLSNSESYRRRLAEAKSPCVPYLGMWLGDLTFLNECIKKEREDPARAQQALERQAQIDALLDDIARYQQNSVYPQLEVVTAIQDSITSFQIVGDVHKIEDEQYQRSRVVEPKRTGAGAGGVDAGGVVVGVAGSKSGTIKGIRNRMRGNSGSVRCEPVNNGLLELHLARSLDGDSRHNILEDPTTSPLGTLDNERQPQQLNRPMDETVTAGARKDRKHQHGYHHHRSGSSSPHTHINSNKSSAEGGLQVSQLTSTANSIAARLKAGAGSKPPSSPRGKTRGHRRSKSGSAVGVKPHTANHQHQHASANTGWDKNSRLSVGSVSDFLVSKGWADEGGDDDSSTSISVFDNDKSSREDMFTSADTSRTPSDQVLLMAMVGMRDRKRHSDGSVSVTQHGVGFGPPGVGIAYRSSRSQSEKDGLGGSVASRAGSVGNTNNPGGMVLEAPTVTILPDAESDDESDGNAAAGSNAAVNGPIKPDESFDELSSNTCDISCVTPSGPSPSSTQQHHPPGIFAGKLLSASRRGSPSSSMGSVTNSNRGSVTGRRTMDDAAVISTTMLNSESLPDLLTGTALQQQQQPRGLTTGGEPVLQAQLRKKDELQDSGTRAAGRKWQQVWVVLHQGPPRLEFFKVQKGADHAAATSSVPRLAVTITAATPQPRKSAYTPARRSTLVTSIVEDDDHQKNNSSVDSVATPTTTTMSSMVTNTTSGSSVPPTPTTSTPPATSKTTPPPIRSPGSPSQHTKQAGKKGIWHVMSSMGSSSNSAGSSTLLASTPTTAIARSRSGSASSKFAVSRASKTIQQDPSLEDEHLQTIPLLRGSSSTTQIAMPANYKKRKHILRVFPGPGPRRTLLLCTESDQQMWEWINVLNDATAVGD
ncbi:hypothetical protein DFJ77DRAFT_474645 [Powellomyces hirtus]|nr:hypothetical protein DFJ77DRAFT_474645 [Powellomyces hirtus]